MPPALRLLVIEDNAAFVQVLQSIFGGYTTLTARPSLSDGLAFLRAQDVDAIILDLALPDSSPAQTIARIDEIRHTAPRARLIVCTGLIPDPPPDIHSLVDTVLLKSGEITVAHLRAAVGVR